MMHLVPFATEHFDMLASWFKNEGDVVQWGGPAVSFPLGANQFRQMTAEGLGEQPSRLCWMIANDIELVGHAQLGIDWRHGNVLLSRVAVKPALRGRGLAVPMLRLVVEEAFARPEIALAELNVYSWNAPAIKTYQRLRFVGEGVRRSSARVGDERWDTTIMGLLKEEWLRRAD